MSPHFKPLLYHFEVESSELPDRKPDTPQFSDVQKKAVRDLLRYGGYKPSGRGRPASESLAKAFHDGRFPEIHPVVDFFNCLSLKTALPISVLDGELLQGEWSFRLGDADESYIFNPSGQELKVEGLPVLADGDGPTGSPVKDAQRTKISKTTSRFLVVVWGTDELPESLATAERETRDWLTSSNATLL